MREDRIEALLGEARLRIQITEGIEESRLPDEPATRRTTGFSEPDGRPRGVFVAQRLYFLKLLIRPREELVGKRLVRADSLRRRRRRAALSEHWIEMIGEDIELGRGLRTRIVL